MLILLSPAGLALYNPSCAGDIEHINTSCCN